MFRFVRRALVSVGFLATALGCVSPAHATLVVGRFDPNFGGALNGVNFSGTATFNISQNCLNLGLPLGAFVFSGYHCGGAPSDMQFLGADVHFSGAQTGDVHFNAQANVILGMYVQNGEVIGVQSRTIGGLTGAQSSLPGHPSFDIFFGVADWALLDPFETNAPVHNDGDHDLDDLSPDHFQQTHLILLGCERGCVSSAAATQYVPEPGSLALVIGALGAAGLAGQRRRRFPPR